MRKHVTLKIIMMVLMILAFIQLYIYNYNPVIIAKTSAEKTIINEEEKELYFKKYNCSGFLVNNNFFENNIVNVSASGPVCKDGNTFIYEKIIVNIKISKGIYIIQNFSYFYNKGVKVIINVEKPINGTAYLILKSENNVYYINIFKQVTIILPPIQEVYTISLYLNGWTINGSETFRVGFYILT